MVSVMGGVGRHQGTHQIWSRMLCEMIPALAGGDE